MTSEAEPQLLALDHNVEGQDAERLAPIVDIAQGEFGVPEDLNVAGDAVVGGSLQVSGTLEVTGDLIIGGRIIEGGEERKISEEKIPQIRKKFERFKKIRGV